MCGICGVFSDRKPEPGTTDFVQSMMDRLEHRGPDGEGMFSGSFFCLGHRRLSIIDLEHGAQPMSTPDNRYSLSFNGEIYNYIELREELKKEGAEFRTSSDTEVLLQALIAWGERALDKLNGMFAFAFVDAEKGEWLIARDPFGIKPLYYSRLNGEFIFASEIKALLCHPGLEARSSWRAMQHYLTFQFCLHGSTLFEHVEELEPGFYLRGRGCEVAARVRYWDTNYRIDYDHTEDYFYSQLVDLLDDTARLQIRSDVPVGAYLSGGIDSSIVSRMAADHVGDALPVFHGKFAEGPSFDESEYAKILSDHVGGNYQEIIPTAEQFVEYMPQLIYAMDEPVAGPGLFPQFMVSKLAAEHVKVVLGGQGGDEVFGGYARYLVGYLEQALKGAIFETQEEGNFLVTLNSIVPNLPLLQEYTPLMQHFWKDGLFSEMDARYFRLIDRSPDVESLLSQDAMSRFKRDEVYEDFQRVFNHPETTSYLNKMTHFDQKTLLPALLQVEDRVSMAVSLESRVPLLDRRIVDLVTTMPPPMKFRGGKTKFMLKRAIKDKLPAEIFDRKDKMGFPVPLNVWMQGGVVRDFVGDTLLSRASRERGLFDPNGLEGLINREAKFGRQLWGALCLELWHQRFIDA